MKRPAVKGKVFLALQLSLLFSSLSGVASKMAAKQPFLSLPFCLCLAADSALSATYLCLRK